jgi:hypothetical protein
MWAKFSKTVFERLERFGYNSIGGDGGCIIIDPTTKTMSIESEPDDSFEAIYYDNEYTFRSGYTQINKDSEDFVVTTLVINGYTPNYEYLRGYKYIYTESLEFDSASRPWGESFANLIPKEIRGIDYYKLCAFLDEGQFDIPSPNETIMYFPPYEEASRNLFYEYGIISVNTNDIGNPYRTSKYITKKSSDKYHLFRYNDGALQGAYLYDGEYSWTTLRLYTFIMHRLDDKKKCDKFLEELDKLRFKYDESDFKIIESLVEGYDSTPIDSCMQEHGNFYLNFEDSGVLLTYDCPQFVGRAIVWSDQYIEGLPEGCQGFMDRIYPSGNHKVVEVFKKYAKNHNLLYKRQQSYDDKTTFVWKDENTTLNLQLSPVNAGKTPYNPYMDTFGYTDDFQTYCNTDGYVSLDSTKGGNSEVDVCCQCGCLMDTDESNHANDDCYCNDCFNDEYFYCDSCGDYEHHDNGTETADGHLCEHCFDRGDYGFCVDTDQYESEYTTTQDTHRHFNSTDDLYLCVDNDLYYEHSSNLIHREDTDTYHLKD